MILWTNESLENKKFCEGRLTAANNRKAEDVQQMSVTDSSTCIIVVSKTEQMCTAEVNSSLTGYTHCRSTLARALGPTAATIAKD